ncbi:TOMM precursor leader peptide-binding protein [Dictyobacter arantiisoli]|nr:TOMM precursor leader peptide-binding protein [Dictyobacter arantiisoli]
MQPRFNADVYYIPLDDGVYLRSNNNGLALKGMSLYPLLKHLVPHLDGTATLAEITAGLDVDKKRMVTNLIEKLATHHFLHDVSQDQSHTLDSEDLATYTTNITFINSFQTSATSRFEHFRNQKLLLIGSGYGFIALIQACLHCGVKHIAAIDTLESSENRIATPAPAFIDRAAQFSRCDAEQSVQFMAAPAWDHEAEVRPLLQDCDAMLHISDQAPLARAQLLNRLCIEQQKILIQAIVVDEHAWIGPLVSPTTGACWECAWRRLQANSTQSSAQAQQYAFYDQSTTTNSLYLTRTTAAINAQRLIFEVFKYFTLSNPGEAPPHLSSIDLKTGTSQSHTYLPHPHCQSDQHPPVPTAAQFLEQIQRLQLQNPIEPQILSEKLAHCFDDRLGLFTALDDDDFAQTFLAVYQVRLSNPMLTQYAPDATREALTTIAASSKTQNARLRACQKACTRYAANLVDQRRLLSQEALQHHPLPAIAPTQLIGIQAPSNESESWTWALDLHTQQVYPIPAQHVFCPPQESERGIAAGINWHEAICQALLDWCQYLTLEELREAHQPYKQVDLAHAPMTAEGDYLYHLLTTALGQITVYDVTGSLQVPTFAFCLTGPVVTYSTHCDIAQALETGCERALQQYQAEQFRQPVYALAPVPDLPASRRSNQLSVPSMFSPATWAKRQARLLETLQTQHLRALAIPLDHDPALMQVLPFIVRVLLTQTEVQYGA